MFEQKVNCHYGREGGKNSIYLGLHLISRAFTIIAENQEGAAHKHSGVNIQVGGEVSSAAKRPGSASSHIYTSGIENM